MSGMTLNHGKFYKDGVQVPLEFGNTEQIQLLKKARDYNEGIWIPFGTFTCLCGVKISFSQFNNGKFICQCNNHYGLEEDEDDGTLIVKLK